MSVHYKPAGGFKAETAFDMAAIQSVQLRRPYGNEPGTSKRERRTVKGKTKKLK